MKQYHELLWCYQQQRLDHARQPFQVFLVGRVALGVAARELGDLLPGPLLVLPREHVAAIGEGREERRVLGIHAKAEALKRGNATTAAASRQEEASGEVCAASGRR